MMSCRTKNKHNYSKTHTRTKDEHKKCVTGIYRRSYFCKSSVLYYFWREGKIYVDPSMLLARRIVARIDLRQTPLNSDHTPHLSAKNANARIGLIHCLYQVHFSNLTLLEPCVNHHTLGNLLLNLYARGR